MIYYAYHWHGLFGLKAQNLILILKVESEAEWALVILFIRRRLVRNIVTIYNKILIPVVASRFCSFLHYPYWLYKADHHVYILSHMWYLIFFYGCLYLHWLKINKVCIFTTEVAVQDEQTYGSYAIRWRVGINSLIALSNINNWLNKQSNHYCSTSSIRSNIVSFFYEERGQTLYSFLY